MEEEDPSSGGEGDSLHLSCMNIFFAREAPSSTRDIIRRNWDCCIRSIVMAVVCNCMHGDVPVKNGQQYRWCM